MVFVGVVTFDVHDYEVGGMVAAEDDASGGAATREAFEYFEIGLEEVVEKGAFACILGSDDGDGKVILVAVFERL